RATPARATRGASLLDFRRIAAPLQSASHCENGIRTDHAVLDHRFVIRDDPDHFDTRAHPDIVQYYTPRKPASRAYHAASSHRGRTIETSVGGDRCAGRNPLI